MLVIGDSLLHHVRKPVIQPAERVETFVQSIGGCTIDRLTSLIKQNRYQALFNHQKHLIILIGTNNLAREHSKSAMKKFKNLLDLIDRKYSFLTTIAVCTVPDRTRDSIYYRTYGDNGGKSIRKRIHRYNRKLKELKKKRNQSKRFDIIRLKFDLSVHVSTDGLHPNSKGIEYISNVIQNYADTL